MRFNKRLGAVIGALTMVIAGAGVAYALFSATGTGSGKATVATAVSITITPSTCANGLIYPGGPPGAICFTLTNSNPYAVSFTSVTYLPGTSAITANNASCPATNASLVTTAPTTVNFFVSGNSTSSMLSIAGVLQMASGAGDACQGASFNVPIGLAGLQQ